MYTDPMEKAVALRKALLERSSANKDFSYCLSTQKHQASLDMCDTIEESEVKRCFICQSNTAPGIDAITVEVIRACLESIKDTVAPLFRRDLSFGYHLKAVQGVEIVVLPKPNKRDLSSPRS